MNPPSSRVWQTSEIVRLVLPQLARLRSSRELTSEEFAAKLKRLMVEELVPRNMHAIVRDLADGTTRFIIRGSWSDKVF
jgi:hypothetical protein